MSLATSTTSQAVRRSTRVWVQLSVLVTSLDPIVPFSQPCETLVVNYHGGALNSPQSIANGTPVLLQLEDGRQTMARVMRCVAADGKWTVAIKLDRAGNFWNVQPCPEDWLVAGDRTKPAPASPPKTSAAPLPSEPATSPKLNAWPLATPSAATETAKPSTPSPHGDAAPSQPLAKAETSTATTGVLKSKISDSPPPSPPEHAAAVASGTQGELQQAVQKFKGELRQVMEENLKVMAAQSEALQEKIQSIAKLKGEIGVWLKVVPELVQEQISKVREEARAEVTQELHSIVADGWERLERQVSELAVKADRLVSSESEREQELRTHLEEVVREQLVKASASDGESEITSRPTADIVPLQAQVNDMLGQLGNLQGLRAEMQELRESVPSLLEGRGTGLEETIRQAARHATSAALDELAIGRQIAGVENAATEQIRKVAEGFRTDTESQLRSVAQDFGSRIDVAVAAAVAPLHDETAALARRFAEQQAAGEARQGDEELARQLNPLLQQATEQVRNQLQAAQAQDIASLRQENSGLAQRIAAVDAAGEERVARIREEVTRYLEPLIQGAAETARKQFEAALADAVAPVQHQTAAFGERVAAMDELGRQASEQVQRIPELIAAQRDAVRQELSSQLAAEIQAQIADLRVRAEQATAEQGEHNAAAVALLQELAGARDNLKSLLQAAPEKIEAVIRDSVAAALAAMQGEASNQIRSQLQAQAEELQSALRKQAEEVSARMHDELLAGLKQRLETSFNDKHAVLERELGERLEQTAKHASESLEGAARGLFATLEQQFKSEAAAQQEHWRAEQSAAAAEISALRSQFAAQLAQAQSDLGRVHLEWGARGEQIIGEILERARGEFAGSLDFMQKEQLSRARSETEQALAPMLSRAGSITNDLRSALASVEREQSLANVQVGALRQEREQLQAWLVRRSGEFHKALQDALVEATGEVKGRMHLATELMDERLRKTGEEAGVRLQGIAEHQANELAARLKGTQDALATSAAEGELLVKTAQHELEDRLKNGREQLKKTEEDAKRALAASLDREHTQSLEKFRAAAEQASADALARWQTEIAEKLHLVQQILANKNS